ncbi:hypothetical protein R3P38DRAFT_3310802 [Favolaschia claudopus]|uniref:MYND-type domain-containing protein n=1 Tax=Favolaschia claudopus TaxID=2862362 RepID=A0AAW0CHR2_9AGAR
MLVYRTCATCYKPETKKVKYSRCGACKKPAYCSKECQAKDWPNHKRTCKFQSENRESLPAKGTEGRDLLKDIKKWFAKHTQLLLYAAVHAMKVYGPADVHLVKTHMLVLELQPAPSGRPAEFVYKYAGLRETKDPRYELSADTCNALASRAQENRLWFTMYVKCDAAVYLAPISIELGPRMQYIVGFGPPDTEWNGFLRRAIDKTLEAKDGKKIKILERIAN